MNIPTLTTTAEQADALWREYRDSIKKENNTADAWLCRAYRALRRKDRVLNIADAFRATGVDDKGRPIMAFMRADKTECWLGQHRDWRTSKPYQWRFTATRNPPSNARCDVFEVSNSWLGLSELKPDHARTTLPPIPPRFRPPADKLHLYWLLWEAAWESIPVDPLLLRPLGGPFYTIVAQWDLTAAERAVLDYQRNR